MKKIILLLIILASSLPSYSSDDLKKEAYDSISNMVMRMDYTKLFTPPYEEAIMKEALNVYYRLPWYARFWIYDLVEYSDGRGSDCEFGIYKALCLAYTDKPYYVLFRNNRYRIYDNLDEHLREEIKQMLSEAGIDRKTRRRVFEKLDKSLEEQVIDRNLRNSRRELERQEERDRKIKQMNESKNN